MWGERKDVTDLLAPPGPSTNANAPVDVKRQMCDMHPSRRGLQPLPTCIHLPPTAFCVPLVHACQSRRPPNPLPKHASAPANSLLRRD